MLETLESGHVPVSAGLLRSCCEGMVLQEDMESLISKVSAMTGKLTATRVKEAAAAIKDDRMLRWVVLHSKLGADRIHQTRSVLPPSCLACL